MWNDKERMKEQTEEHLNRMPVARMKNFDGDKGMAGFNDNKYKLVVDGTHKLIEFDTIDELSDAGWTID